MTTRQHSKTTARPLAREWPLVVLLTLLTAVLRAADVLGRSMWPDEGATYLRLAESLPDILRNIVHIDGAVVIDTHPPFYFVLLKLWTLAGGDSEFSLKWFAVCAGILLTPLIYVLARRAFSQRAAVAAAVFIGLSPGIEWYSHEARMYTVVLCMAALTMYTLLRALRLRAQDVKWWVAWAVCIALAFFTHYTFVGMLIGQVGLAAWILARQWRSLPTLLKRVVRMVVIVAVVAGIVLLLLPEVRGLVSRLATGNDMNYVFHSFDVLVWTQISGFIIGLNVPDPNNIFITLGVYVLGGLCVLMALVPAQNNERPDAKVARPLLLVSILATLFIWWGLSFFKANYQGFRHLILVTPALAVLLGRGVDWLLRRPAIAARAAGGLLAVGIVAGQGYGLVYTFTRTPDWHDDWRSVSTFIQDRWQDGDVIVVDSATHLATLQPYLRGFPFDLNRWSLPDAVDETQAAQYAAAVQAQYRRIWLVKPDGHRLDVYRHYMHVNGPYAFPTRSVAVELYLVDTQVPVLAELPATAQPLPGALDLKPAAGVVLAGYEIRPPARYNPQSNAIVSLYWRRTGNNINADVLGSINTSFRLQDQGQVWWDWLLPGHLFPMPSQWVPGTYLRVDHVLPLPLGLPKLPYMVQWAATQGAKQERFQVAEMALPDDWRDCCMRLTQWPLVNIALTFSGVPMGAPLQSPLAAPGASAANIPEVASPIVVKLPNALRLWTSLRGDDVQIDYVEFPSTVKPGEALQAVVTWQAAQSGSPGWDTELKLETLVGNEVASIRQNAATDAFPVKDWPIGEPVRGMYSVQVPYSVPPGWYRLMLNRWRDGTSVGGVILGLVHIELHPPSPVPTVAQITHPVDARAGEVRLLGYSVEQPIIRGVTLNFHTYWQVDAQPTRDGVLFLHTDNDVCRPACPQDDNPPERGLRSTLSYRAGDGMDQIHQIVLPPDMPGGEYKLYAGIYDKEGFARWPASENGQPAKDDLIYIGSFTLPDLPPLPVFKYQIYLANILQAN